MMRALFTGSSGMRGQQFKIDVTANNLANVNTTGFKADRAEFHDLLYQSLRRPGGTSATGTGWPSGLQVGLGATPVTTVKLFTAGSVINTDQWHDLAIFGDGFFQVTMPDGTIAYTRDGSFSIDANGDMLNSQGNYLEPAINIPQDATEVIISYDGTVSVKQSGQQEDTQIGNIDLVRFVNPQGLQPLGDNLFAETSASGTPQVDTPGLNGLGTIRQGYLENSNVSVVDELVSLIVGQRAYEANSRSVQTSDEMLQTAVNLKR